MYITVPIFRNMQKYHIALYRGYFWKEIVLLQGRESSGAQSIYTYIHVKIYKSSMATYKLPEINNQAMNCLTLGC